MPCSDGFGAVHCRPCFFLFSALGNTIMFLLFVIYCIVIALASVLGGFLPLLFKLTHLRMQVALSFISGMLLGVGLLHMLPHALAEGAPVTGVAMAFLGGFLLIFFLERFFCFHHHESDDPSDEGHEGCSHGHHSMDWLGTFFGMTVHTLLAGIALGSSVFMSYEIQTAEVSDGAVPVLMSFAGFGTFLAIVFHKPFDALTITTVMRVSGASRGRTVVANILFALMIPLGILLFFFVDGIGTWHHLTAYALAFSAGTFLCIAAADLMPELQFHKHDRVLLSGALIVGLGVAWATGLFETHDHDHAHDHAPAAAQAETAEAGHDHAHHDHDHDHDHDH